MKALDIILTSDGGNGHKAAADAIAVKSRKSEREFTITNVTSENWYDYELKLGFKLPVKLPFNLSTSMTALWDWSQRKGYIEILRVITALRNVAFLCGPIFRSKTYELIKEQNDNKIYDQITFHNTQPICLKYILQAVAKYNKEVLSYNKLNKHSKPQIIFINHFTDMPSWQATMFINELRSLDAELLDHANFILYSKTPALNISQEELALLSEEELGELHHVEMARLYPKLYQKLLKDSSGEYIYRVKFVDGPIRQEFIDRKEYPATKKELLPIIFAEESEYSNVRQILMRELSSFSSPTRTAKIQLNPSAYITTVMLGSQASINGTLELLHENISSITKQLNTDTDRSHYIFVFCGKNDPSNGFVLYGKVLELALNAHKTTRGKLKIIPLSNQPSAIIAQLYSVADLIVTRPGGISIMEIEAVAKKAKVLIFTELSRLQRGISKLLSLCRFLNITKLMDYFSGSDVKTLLKSLVVWEAGNAEHISNIMRDENGLSKVAYVNIYNYQHELELFKLKEKIIKHVDEHNYLAAFYVLKSNQKLNKFFASGHGSVVDLACLSIVHTNLQSLQNIIVKFSESKKIQITSDALALVSLKINEILNRVEIHLSKGYIPLEVLQYMQDDMLDLERFWNDIQSNLLCSNINLLTDIFKHIVSFLNQVFKTDKSSIVRKKIEKLDYHHVESSTCKVLRHLPSELRKPDRDEYKQEQSKLSDQRLRV